MTTDQPGILKFAAEDELVDLDVLLILRNGHEPFGSTVGTLGGTRASAPNDVQPAYPSRDRGKSYRLETREGEDEIVGRYRAESVH